jgi:hypothetical protein
MYLSGISYFVLADHFLVHQSHLYEEVTRRHEVLVLSGAFFLPPTDPSHSKRKYNRKVFTDFREETCLRWEPSFLCCNPLADTQGSCRYLKSYYEHGVLNTTEAGNALEECRKIKGVSKLASQVGSYPPPHTTLTLKDDESLAFRMK